MKKFSILATLVLALILITSMGNAQSNISLFANKAYAVSTVDTSASFWLPNARAIDLYFYHLDSASLEITLDVRVKGATSWIETGVDGINQDQDSVTYLQLPAGYHTWVLRNNTVEKFAGIMMEGRLRFKWASGDCGTTTAKFYAYLKYRN